MINTGSYENYEGRGDLDRGSDLKQQHMQQQTQQQRRKQSGKDLAILGCGREQLPSLGKSYPCPNPLPAPHPNAGPLMSSASDHLPQISFSPPTHGPMASAASLPQIHYSPTSLSHHAEDHSPRLSPSLPDRTSWPVINLSLGQEKQEQLPPQASPVPQQQVCFCMCVCVCIV